MRVNPWLKKSEQNLIPLSISNDFSGALKEWFFTGDVEDHLGELVECEMCEHPELRYHFEIKNRLKENVLWVGSSCIERFQEIEDKKEAEKTLPSINSMIDKLAKKNIIHSNKAANLKSNMAKHIAAL